MNDWNGNGKYDAFDSYVDYKGANSYHSSGGSSDWWIWALLAIVAGACPALGVIIVLGILIFG